MHRKGLGHTINVPLARGLSPSNFTSVFERVVADTMARIKPQAIVMQCGCDGLAGDPLGGWNLDSLAYARACRFVAQYAVPTLFLGGGGYVSENAAKCWTLCTLVIQDPLAPLDRDSIPMVSSAAAHV